MRLVFNPFTVKFDWIEDDHTALSNIGTFTHDDIDNHINVTKEPTGFPNRTDSTLSLSTRTFTINATGVTFDYYILGAKYTVTTSDNITVPDEAGLHVIYYDGATLSQEKNPDEDAFDNLMLNMALVALVYWNASDGAAYIIGDERHGCHMSSRTHEWIHDIIGTVWVQGLAISGYTEEDGSADSSLTFEISNGEIYDQDLDHNIIDAANASGQYEQILNGEDAQIPVLYRDDVDGTWKEDAASTLPYKTGGTGRLAYNKDDGDSTWSQVEVTNNKWVSATLIATNDWQYPIKMVQGQNLYTEKKTAVEDATNEILSWGNFPTLEMVILYRFVMQTSNSYASTPKCRIEEDGVSDFRGSRLGAASAVSTDHGSLGGLADDDHAQYHTDARGDERYVQLATLTNKAGANTVVGYVYRLDPDNDESFDYASEDEDAQVCVAQTADIVDSASATDMVISGIVDIYVTGDTDNGDFLYFSSTPGQAKPLKNLYHKSCFAKAIEDQSGAGLVAARLFNKERQITLPERTGWGDHARVPMGVPTKYGSNPILEKGAVDSWEESYILPAAVLWDWNTEQFIMFYEALDSSAVRAMGVAYADNPLGPWTKYGSNPVFEVGANGQWDDNLIWHFHVIEELNSKKFRVYYAGREDPAQKMNIGTADSSDGITWSNRQKIIDGGATDIFAPSAVTLGDRYLLFVDYGGVTRPYESSDGITFTYYGAGISLAPGQAWYAVKPTNFSFFFDQGILYAWFTGLSGAPPYLYQCGFAVNYGDRYTFKNDMLNPAIVPGAATEWDDEDVLFAKLFLYDGIFYVYYAGDGGSGGDIGVATIEGP